MPERELDVLESDSESSLLFTDNESELVGIVKTVDKAKGKLSFGTALIC